MTDRPRKAASNGPAKILLVDDHPIVRQGITELIEHEEGVSVCCAAENVSEAMQAIAELKPDLAVVDLSLQDSSGLELIKEIKARYPDVLVLVLSMHDETLYAERVLRAGAKGYVMKEEATERLMTAIRKVLRGQVYLSDQMSARMLSKFVDGTPTAGDSAVGRLSDRELQVFELIGKGLGTRQIAKSLHLSVKTIESHREHIKDKLRLTSSQELMRHAMYWQQFERLN
ncbi:MAG: response regulator transcription factor [Phycisphaerales bacterium]|nr:MAG: response regulator transcription factor [Phycisphaerales bacterium]